MMHLLLVSLEAHLARSLKAKKVNRFASLRPSSSSSRGANALRFEDAAPDVSPPTLACDLAVLTPQTESPVLLELVTLTQT